MSLFSKDPPAPPAPPPTYEMAASTRARLGELRGDDGRGALFTSDLSVNEFLMIQNAGFEPLGLVVGSSIYHIGYQPMSWSVSQEMTTLSQAMYTARELAMSRMEEEAAALGADGVVAVRLEVGSYDWGESLAEFKVIGTAVRSRDGGNYHTVEGKPFTSDLTGHEFAVLRAMGYAPAGMVLGSCVYHIAHQSWRQAFATLGQNTEMVNFTQALYDAREIAMERMQAEAKQLRASGIVGVDVHQKTYTWETHVIEFFAVGTAIVPHPAPPQPAVPFVVNIGS